MATTAAPLRVAVDATPLLASPTGVGQLCDALLAGLVADRDVDVVAYALSFRPPRPLSAVVPPGVRVGGPRFPAAALHRLWLRLPVPTVENLTGPVDVVHGTNFVVPPTARAAAVTTVHDLTAVHFPQLCTSDTRRYPALVRAAIQRGAWVHTPSEFVADEVREHFGVEAGRVRAVLPGVPDVPAADPAAGHRLAGADRYVLALGTVEPRKNLPLLVEAFDDLAADHPEVGLVIAGADGWGSDDLTAAVSASHHQRRIRRLGRVSPSERAQLLRGASVLAYPSRYEGFGFPPLEAMAAGVPVVATAAGAVPEVAGSAARLVPVGDRHALGQALAAVLDDRDEAERLVAAGRDRVAGLGWDRCVRELVALYRSAEAARGG